MRGILITGGDPMESRELRYFLAVAGAGSFTRAAERLFVSQPALSRAVRQLERDLDTVLFVRTNRGATLTPAGEVLLREGSAALLELDRAVTRTRAAAQPAHWHGSLARPFRLTPEQLDARDRLDRAAG